MITNWLGYGCGNTDLPATKRRAKSAYAETIYREPRKQGYSEKSDHHPQVANAARGVAGRTDLG